VAAAAAKAAAAGVGAGPLTIQCSDPSNERDQLQKLYVALSEAKKKAGNANAGNFDSFSSFVEKKTKQIRKQYGCQAVEYTVETQNGEVRLKAKAKI
jgi:hypothetical protein